MCPQELVQYNGYAWNSAFSFSQSTNDPLLVQLGGYDPNVQDSVQESAHMMHELGHTFGLAHGGATTLHRKPNCLSVMNYNYSYRGLWLNGGYGTLDYSRFELPDLDEVALDESSGLGAPMRLTVESEANPRMVAEAATTLVYSSN